MCEPDVSYYLSNMVEAFCLTFCLTLFEASYRKSALWPQNGIQTPRDFVTFPTYFNPKSKKSIDFRSYFGFFEEGGIEHPQIIFSSLAQMGLTLTLT